MENSFPKGSEWRKWDTHIHTPASVLHNNFGSDWDIYVKNLFKILIEKNIIAIGITDYFTIDGFKKIKEEYLADDTKLSTLFSDDEIKKIKRILIIPNIEFRSDIFVGPNSINFHIIFSEHVSMKDIEEKFLHDIHFVYQGEPQSEDKKRVLKEGNLIELGAQLKSEHSEFGSHSDLYVGMMNAVVDHKEISKILSEKANVFGGKYLFVVADEDLSEVKWNSRDHLTRKVLIQKSDMIFSSNKKTREWALGKPPYEEGTDKFIKEFKTLKPCIHGSDAHDYKYIGYPCAKRRDKLHDCSTNPQVCELRYCWIKADTTFEGLKQILYEPEDRVLIQSSNPTRLKSTQTISELDIEETTLETELKFLETKLPLNDGLVAITGGKGSGKTALVDILANFYENRASCDDKNSFVKRIAENVFSNDLNTTITLQNDLPFQKEVKEDSFIEGATIVYVAQGELEKHVEDPAHLETYINNLIFESNELRDSALSFDYDNINNEVIEISDKISAINRDIFTLENETGLKIEENLSKDAKKLITDLGDTKKKIEELAKGLSAEKIKEAEQKQKQLTELRDKKEQLSELGITIKETLQFIDTDFNSFNKNITKISTLAAKLNFKNQFKIIEYADTGNLKDFIKTVRDILRKTIAEIENFQKDLEEKEKGVMEHARLLDKKKELEKAIQQIKEKIAIITEKKKTLDEELKKRDTLFEELLSKRVEQKDKYLSIINAFSQNKSDILSDLEFTAELIFNRNRFNETMSELVDLRKIRVGEIDNTASDIDFFTNAMTDLVSNPSMEKVNGIAHTSIGELIKKIVPNQKKAETISRLTIYNSIFADYLSVMPSVKYKKVKLLKLSLGQKATVLIKIYLAQGENPIIIDSHDDHLDNEFIMDELVKALRQAKQYRQVIVVSNNGNVVVNSDAEQVIIACRNDLGEISYSSGSLENATLRPKLLSVLEGGEQAFSKRQQKYRLHS
jgi:ABC-type cobalamin/Fe3+-siderophores transport system ATPase subunit